MATAQEDRFGASPGSGVKPPVRVATTANITLNGEQTIDSVAIVDGDRVLVMNQTDGTENGIYECGSGDWSRVADFNASGDVVAGMTIPAAAEGGAGAGIYQITFTGAFVLGTTDATYTKIV
jgi:hypothetical protein